MLPTKEVFDINKLDLFTKKEKEYYGLWMEKALDFIKGEIEVTEIKYMTRIVEDLIKIQHKRASNAQLLWRMKNSNEKDLHDK